MNYTVDRQPEKTTITIVGELDAVTVPDLRDELDRLLVGNTSGFEVDLSGLRMIDSSGVGVLVSLYKRGRAHGQWVRVTGLREQPLAIFRLLKLDAILAASPA